MCGIVGYIGSKDAVGFLINGLEKLEYRGYDSAGIAVCTSDKLYVCKEKGRLSNLKDALKEDSHNKKNGKIGIGHTRWATHGEANRINSHPHVSENEKIAVVHNGIIENFYELREFLKNEGYEFKSETDTEVIPHLIEFYYDGDLFSAFKKAVERLKGSYAIGMISSYEPDKLYAVRKDSPLIIGKGNNENFIASDIPAVLSQTRDIYFLDDNEFAVLTDDKVEISDISGKKISKAVSKIEFSEDVAEKGGYEHFMIKEINEQPRAISDTLRGRMDEKLSIYFDNFNFDEIKDIRKIYIVACGTAYHAGLVGRFIIEKMCSIPVCVEAASEFRYNSPLIDKHTLIIAVSQSGETADTLAGVRLAKKKNSKILAVTNVVGSSLSREADYVFYTYAGPEISVASTKAYTTQLVMLYLIALYIAENKKTVSENYADTVKKELINLPDNIKNVLLCEDEIKKIAENIYEEKDIYFIGRGLDYAVSLEGSLKLKEISYIHSESYASGELKHGPIALIEDKTFVIALSTDKNIAEKMESNIKEVKSRGAYVVVVANEDTKVFHKSADKMVIIPLKSSILSPVSSVVPLQLLAYYAAKFRGNDIDKPKNLAKSVTVE